MFGNVAKPHIVRFSSCIPRPTHTMAPPPPDRHALQEEIADLERRLHDAKARLNPDSSGATPSSAAGDGDAGPLSLCLLSLIASI